MCTKYVEGLVTLADEDLTVLDEFGRLSIFEHIVHSLFAISGQIDLDSTAERVRGVQGVRVSPRTGWLKQVYS